MEMRQTGVVLTLDLDNIKDPAVNNALQQLVAALGRVEQSPRRHQALAPVKTVERAPRRKPAERSFKGSVGDRYTAFVERLPARSRRFLELVEARGVLTIDEAMKELDIKVPKAIGGVTGSIGRWAPERGVVVPYKKVMQNGRRAWRWIGIASTEEAAADDKEEALAAPETPEKVVLGPDESFFAALPKSSARFMRLLQERKRLTMPEILDYFGLARAKAVGGITEPIRRVGHEFGLDAPFIATRTDDGERLWLWPGTEPTPATLQPAAEGNAQTAPGVRVRKKS